MYVSANVAKERGPRVTTVYTITSYAFREPTVSVLFLYDSGSISYSGGVTSLSITRQQAASILAVARDENMKIERKHITDTEVIRIYVRQSSVQHPANFATVL